MPIQIYKGDQLLVQINPLFLDNRFTVARAIQEVLEVVVRFASRGREVLTCNETCMFRIKSE